MEYYNEPKVTDYVDIPEKMSVENIKKYFVAGKLPVHNLLSKPYNLNDPKLTDTTKYLFYVELETCYDKNLALAFRKLQNFSLYKNNFDNPNVFLGDEDVKDYDANEILLSKDREFIYHILIDIACPFYEQAMILIRKSPFYIDEYIYGDLSKQKVVVRLHSISRRRIELSIEKDFSELFKEKDYAPLIRTPLLAMTYFNLNYVTNTYEFNEHSKVLLGVSKSNLIRCEADAIILRLGIKEQELKELIYQRHGRPPMDILKQQ